jgi:hypothetical protein
MCLKAKCVHVIEKGRFTGYMHVTGLAFSWIDDLGKLLAAVSLHGYGFCKTQQTTICTANLP